MFIVSLKYKADLDQVDRHLDAHKEYLARYFADNIFIAAGRKVPRDGGIIIASADSLERLEEILAEDPFSIADVAEYSVTEFIASAVNECLHEFRDE